MRSQWRFNAKLRDKILHNCLYVSFLMLQAIYNLFNNLSKPLNCDMIQLNWTLITYLFTWVFVEVLKHKVDYLYVRKKHHNYSWPIWIVIYKETLNCLKWNFIFLRFVWNAMKSDWRNSSEEFNIEFTDHQTDCSWDTDNNYTLPWVV